MRRLVTALASLAVVFLLIPSIGLAIELPVESGVGILGIVSSEDLESAENFNAVTGGVPFYIYFYVFNEQIASDNLGGVEFSWTCTPAPIILSMDFPAGGLNIGTNTNIVCGFGLGHLTTNNYARVVRAQLFFATTPPATMVYLGPSTPDSIDGEMAYNDYNNPGDIRVMRPNSVGGLYENPVYGFNVTVATQGETWGGVKALFQ